ncbi:hypothetical protein HHK36_010552 [Tetracentron sinense]|uniref:PRC-barrel domain-containing protein n=1 Tax=Tetracentron sinense TaxID=13715 RepID=A0A835DFE4_TETSI|nr:hypothetical protein HHK36_010552 [Tetracentron sinense]
MCDCVPPTPLMHPCISPRKLGLFRINTKPRIRRSDLIRNFDIRICSKPSNACSSDHVCVRNGGSQFIRGSFIPNGGEIDRLKSMKFVNVGRNSGVSGSENNKLFDELGFKETGEKGFEVDTRHGDVGPENIGSNSILEYGIGLSNEEKEDSRSSNASVSSTFDSLELEGDREDERRSAKGLGSLEDEDLLRIEGSGRVGSNTELGHFTGRSGLKSRRQVIRRSNMLAKQVISAQSALSLGFVSQLWVDTSSWVVLVVEVRPSLLSGEMERFLLEDVCQVGDVVLVSDESVMENEFKMVGLDSLFHICTRKFILEAEPSYRLLTWISRGMDGCDIQSKVKCLSISIAGDIGWWMSYAVHHVGYNVVTPGRRNIGKVRGYTFNINSGAVESIELDSFGISIIPSSLVSTYALFVEDVIEVASDTLVVHEAAASHLQRQTKGFWDTPNVGTSKDEVREYSDLESRHVQSDRSRSRQRSFSSQNFHPKMRETEDDWELPMDYL